jgi:crotonobetainyl-CoA:carnitine CoA-transferase CaiB-like acyl-CoA transferase
MHPNIVPYGTFEVKYKEFIIIGAGTNNQFVSLCHVLGLGKDIYENA